MKKPNLIIFTNTRGSVWQRSIGAYQVAHHCRLNGFAVQIIDFTDFFSETELVEISKKLYSENLLAVGISTTFYSFVNEDFTNPVLVPAAGSIFRGNAAVDKQIASAIEFLKSQNPSIKVFAGGANSWQMEGNNYFDAVFHGYSEESVVKYLEELQQGKKKILYKKIGKQDIVNGDVERFDIERLQHRFTEQDIILNNETLPIEITRGCIFKCKFCSYPLNGKKKFDYIRDYDNIKDELIFNYEHYGTTNYFFTDDTFNDSTEKVQGLHEVFTKLPFKINFVCYLRADLLQRFPEQIKLLKEMGLASVVFGIESFHPYAAKAVGKGTSREKLKKFLLDLYYNHWNEQVSITCSMIVGLPKETEQHLRESFEWFRTEGKDLCDNWYPLNINTTTHYQSAFDKEYSKYGYKLNVNNEEWVSDEMSHSQAYSISKEFNDIAMYKENQPGSWMIMSLRSYGFSQQELMSWKVKDISWKFLLRKRLRMVQEYKNKLTIFVNKF